MRPSTSRALLGLSSLCAAAAVALASAPALARNPEAPENSPKPLNPVTFLDHTETPPFWFSAQQNSIFQAKPAFGAKYTGPNSLSPRAEAAISGVITIYFAYTPHRTTELIADGEMAFGGGLSKALGVAGFTNLDVVRNPTLSSEPYLARVEAHQIIPLSSTWVLNEDQGPTSSFVLVPLHRLELRVGRMSTADTFDINPAGSDSHMQFMNWAVCNNGAYDYAADTRGYTYGAIVEYQGPRVEARFGEMLMPKVANGIDIDFDLSKSHAENLELEIKYLRALGWAGTVRALGYVNHANMGSYREATEHYVQGGDRPDITKSRRPGRTKYGVGLNVVQELFGRARLFARGGYNDGENETFAYTEIDDTFEIGGDLRGDNWQRPFDRLGLAFVTNGLSTLHRKYLRLGGLGFLLGDGGLKYGRETIFETYYNMHVWRGGFVAADFQLVVNPGYNRDRGPAAVFSLREHLEF